MDGQEGGRRTSAVNGEGEGTEGRGGAGADIRSGSAVEGMAAVPATSAEARAAVLAVLESRVRARGGDMAEVVVTDALLITSELVTNATRHGGGLTGFAAEIEGDALRVCVRDASPVRPVSPPAPAAAEAAPRIGGYGWQMVRRLAREVTVTIHGTGKTIAAVLPLA